MDFKGQFDVKPQLGAGKMDMGFPGAKGAVGLYAGAWGLGQLAPAPSAPQAQNFVHISFIMRF